MKRVEPIEYVERGRCDCGVHFLGRCDSDFPIRTGDLPYTDRQLELRLAAREQLGSLSVTEQMLYRDKTHRWCDECGVLYEPERSTSKYCSDACRVKHSRQ